MQYVFKLASSGSHKITIQGVPCPRLDYKDISDEKVKEWVRLIIDFNNELKFRSLAFGFNFIDIHALTNDGNGSSNKLWHIDMFHISSSAMVEAWSNHLVVS